MICMQLLFVVQPLISTQCLLCLFRLVCLIIYFYLKILSFLSMLIVQLFLRPPSMWWSVLPKQKCSENDFKLSWVEAISLSFQQDWTFRVILLVYGKDTSRALIGSWAVWYIPVMLAGYGLLLLMTNKCAVLVKRKKKILNRTTE